MGFTIHYPVLVKIPLTAAIKFLEIIFAGLSTFIVT